MEFAGDAVPVPAEIARFAHDPREMHRDAHALGVLNQAGETRLAPALPFGTAGRLWRDNGVHATRVQAEREWSPSAARTRVNGCREINAVTRGGSVATGAWSRSGIGLREEAHGACDFMFAADWAGAALLGRRPRLRAAFLVSPSATLG